MSNVNDSIRNAMMLAERGRFADAISSLRAILPTHGNNGDLHHTLGMLQFQSGALDQAIFHFEKASHIESDRAEFHSNLGTALNMSGRSGEAVDAFRKAVKIDPNHFPAQLGLSSALIGTIQFDEAVTAAREACRLGRARPEGWVNLAVALNRSGRGGEAVQVLREALTIMPDQPLLLSNLVNSLNYRPDTQPAEAFEQHQRLGKAMVAAYGGSIKSFNNSPAPDRPLRIGYLSTDFKDHSVVHFIAPVLANHDRSNFTPVCYSAGGSADRTTERLKALVPDWRDAARFNDAGIAQQMMRDNIDILVDLGGYQPGSRFGVVAARGAPVQVSWMGYPNTSGTKTVGYRIVDALTDPDSADAFATEKLIRIDGCFLCYQPSPDAPQVSSPPNPPTPGKPVTFSSFSNAQKIVEPVIETWSAILRGLPGSRLLLKAASFEDSDTVQRLKARFAEFGIGADRVEFLERVESPAAHLGLYSRVDISLDTFPYCSAATACEAMDMGVPVVTLRGSTHAGRITASLLRAGGLEGTTADSTESYISIATALASDPARLASLRTGLRARLRNSPLCDGAAFTRKLEAAYRDMWRAWGAKLMYME